MKLQMLPLDSLRAVAGVFGVNPVIRGEPLELSQNRRGSPELVQFGRIVAVGDQRPQLLAFAALNDLTVRNYSDTAVQREPRVFCID